MLHEIIFFFFRIFLFIFFFFFSSRRRHTRSLRDWSSDVCSSDLPLKVGLYGDPAAADDNDVQEWRVFCLNKRTGKTLWQAIAHQGAPKMKRHQIGRASCRERE